MCGIAGFNWSDSDLIQKMTDEMINRGPEEFGHFVNDDISLGHRRLSIIDLSSAGKQPMFDSEQSLAIIHNGEVYNFQEIKDELIQDGYQFKSKTDTEVILYAYKKWGADCVHRFVGMFAFVIYDLKKRELFLCRDHIGIKPLYYYKNGTQFIFTSTIQAILHHKIPTAPNKRVISNFLLLHMPFANNETFFEKILIFPKGHFAHYDLKTDSLKFTKWWENKFTNNYNGNYGTAVSKLHDLMQKSVQRRLISDVPVGTCLSGGIDSSTIACLIDLEEKKEMKTFSATFPGYSIDESHYIDEVQRATGMENHQTTPTSEALRANILDFIRNIGQPIASPSPFAQYNVFRLARENGTTVLLDGQGADELFAGYHHFFGFYFKELMSRAKIIALIKEIIELIKGGHAKTGLSSLLLYLQPKVLQQLLYRRQSNISKSLLKESDGFSGIFEKRRVCNTLHKILEFHLDNNLEILLLYEDRNSMAHSCEARVPFLDPDVMQFVFSLPQHYLMSKGKTKVILRDAIGDIIPAKIFNRRDKIGFEAPTKDWLREEPLQELMDEWFVKSRPYCEEFIDLNKTRRIMKQPRYNKNCSRVLWKTIFLEAWVRSFYMNFK